jgi:hypothetical protein
VYRTGARYGLYPVKEECKEENYDVLLRRGKSVSVDMGITDMLCALGGANGRRATLLQKGVGPIGRPNWAHGPPPTLPQGVSTLYLLRPQRG